MRVLMVILIACGGPMNPSDCCVCYAPNGGCKAIRNLDHPKFQCEDPTIPVDVCPDPPPKGVQTP